MKTLKILMTAILVASLFTSCRKEINGSGVFIVQTRITSPFSEVKSCGDFTVILKEDSVSRIELYGEDNILPEIETDVYGNELRITYRDYNRKYDDNGVTITIYNPKFRAVDMQGSGTITSHTILNSETVNATVSGSGRMDLAVNAVNLFSSISGSGKISFSGSSANANHKISGSGKIAAFGMLSENVNATISGSGDCEVNVIDFLDATISGSGNVLYRGNPRVAAHISGSGKVKPG
ncbi:MAG TPA: head GIN domain-containing protein [Bacteroidia bacterium]|nr:head GIN domain-containing protein [Bacteroidia bacterium]